MDGHVTILLFSIIFILFVYIGAPVGNQELDDFLLPRIIGNVDGHVITAPPLTIGPPVPLGTSRYTEKELHDLLPSHVHETNGYKIYEGTPQISVPMRNVSGYVDPGDPPPLPGIKIRDANGIAIIEGTPQVALPPGIPPVVYGFSLK